MYSRNQDPKNTGELSSFRLSNPLQYSAIAGGLAALVGGTTDLVFFGESAQHALRTAASAAASWFFVVFGLLWFSRWQLKNRRD